MDFQRLTEGGLYDMFVISVLYNRQFQVGNDTKTSYHITLKDDQGNLFKPEYIVTGKKDRGELDQSANASFPVGERVQFKCQLCVPRCDEIIPVTGTGTGEKPAYKPQGTGGNAPHTMIAGQSYSQAMTLAVQIACAECTSLGKEIKTDALFEMAAELDDWFMKRKEMHGF
jgi:hypothetical protein